MKKYLIAGVFVGALLVLSMDWHSLAGAEKHGDAFNSEKALVASADELKRTEVIATPVESFDPRKNVLWCGTFQLAWNETRALAGGDLHFDPESPLVSRLNASGFSTNDLDASSYVALAGFVKDGIHQKIRAALDRKFSGAADLKLIPEKSATMRPQDIVAYAYLFKSLEFTFPFEDLEQPLAFGGMELPAFGMGKPKAGREQMADQVRIIDYKGQNDFIIELKTKSTSDHLLLAKIKPGQTLAETIESVESRTRSAHPENAVAADELRIPKFNFDLTRRYHELEGAKLVARNPVIASDLVLVGAVQNIRFQIDEKGVRLKSESHMEFGCAAAPMPIHVMIFDKPFLVLLKRTDAKNPYFAMWVANPELFAPR